MYFGAMVVSQLRGFLGQEPLEIPSMNCRPGKHHGQRQYNSQVGFRYGHGQIVAGPSDEAAEKRLDTLGDEDERLGRIDAGATVFAAAAELPDRDRRILYLRFGEDLTQAEIAERVGISQMQVSRLLRRAVRRLQELTAEPPAGE